MTSFMQRYAIIIFMVFNIQMKKLIKLLYMINSLKKFHAFTYDFNNIHYMTGMFPIRGEISLIDLLMYLIYETNKLTEHMKVKSQVHMSCTEESTDLEM